MTVSAKFTQPENDGRIFGIIDEKINCYFYWKRGDV